MLRALQMYLAIFCFSAQRLLEVTETPEASLMAGRGASSFSAQRPLEVTETGGRIIHFYRTLQFFGTTTA
ncbi:MAG: hypothetical protein RMJ86_05545 [Anaerolineae bacterium]|nr:hypothetical protein [Anaerolineae bacterium]